MFEHDRFGRPLTALWSALDESVATRVLGHTGLPVADIGDRAAWRARSFDERTVIELRLSAADDFTRPWQSPTAHAWARFRRDGDREEYQQALFDRQARLRRAVLMAAITDNDAWIDEAADGLALACEQSSWCWPAHDEFSATRGLALPDPDEPFLDLGAGEMVADLAWADAVLGSRLDSRWSGLRGLLRMHARRRVFKPFLRHRDWWWINGREGPEYGPNNWNPWIHANVIAAAVQLAEDSREQIIATALAGVDQFVDALPDDGAVAEGYSYWWEGVGRLLDLLVLLKHQSGGTLDAFSRPEIQATIGFPVAMWLGPAGETENWCVNYSDGRAKTSGEPWHTLFAAAVQSGDAASARHALRSRRSNEPVFHHHDSLWRQLAALFDTDWRDARLPAEMTDSRSRRAVSDRLNHPVLPQRVWLPSAQIMVARQEPSGLGLTVSAKGGTNGEPHNHLDVGSFIVAFDGVPFIVDAGRPTYTAKTFGPHRYEAWMMQSQWHNVPQIDGLAQSVGSVFRATDAHFSSDETTTELSYDLAGAYDLPTEARGLIWRRRVRLTGQTVTIDDSWNRPCLSAWHLLVAGSVKVTQGDVEVTTLAGAHVLLTLEPSLPVSLEVKPLDDPLLTKSWGRTLKRLTFDTGHLDHFRLTIDQKGKRHE